MSWTYAQRCIGPAFDAFWTKHPLLLYGLSIYLATLWAYSFHTSLLIPLCILFLPLFCWTEARLRIRLGLAALVGLLFYLHVSNSTLLPPVWAEGIEGVAEIEIVDVLCEIRYNRPSAKMKVDLLSFEAKDRSFFAKNIPCTIICKQPHLRPKADSRYKVMASLSEHQGVFRLHVNEDAGWVKQEPIFSLVEWRISAKAHFKCLLAQFLPSSQTRSFLEGVVIGEFHDPLLSQALSRFSLQHITVVSGFHFSLMAALLGTLFRLFFSWRACTLLLMMATGGYLLFVGANPSVLRAFVAVFCLLLSKLLAKKTNGINCLGLGLIVCLAYEPTWATSLSFTLSFLATWAILLFYPLTYECLLKLFPKRSAAMLLQMSFFDQLAFVLLAFFRASFALVFSVSLLMLPASLYLFHQFPLLGIIYNCFFPFFITVAVSLLTLGLLVSWLQPVASLFFQLAELVTESALTHVTMSPSYLDVTLYCPDLSLGFIVAYLCLISFFGIAIYKEPLANQWANSGIR